MRDHVKLAVDGPVCETWSLGYLVDTIYLRDLWMHRVDAAYALDRSFELSPEHDGRIVADVVAECGRCYGKPFVPELTGPAGGRFVRDSDRSETEHISLEAIKFCRLLAGRGAASGLLTTVVPF